MDQAPANLARDTGQIGSVAPTANCTLNVYITSSKYSKLSTLYTEYIYIYIYIHTCMYSALCNMQGDYSEDILQITKQNITNRTIDKLNGTK